MSKSDWWFITINTPGLPGTIRSGFGIVQPLKNATGRVVSHAMQWIQRPRTDLRLDGRSFTHGATMNRCTTSPHRSESDADATAIQARMCNRGPL